MLYPQNAPVYADGTMLLVMTLCDESGIVAVGQAVTGSYREWFWLQPGFETHSRWGFAGLYKCKRPIASSATQQGWLRFVAPNNNRLKRTMLVVSCEVVCGAGVSA